MVYERHLPNVFHQDSIDGSALVVKNTFIDLDDKVSCVSRTRRARSSPVHAGTRGQDISTARKERAIFLREMDVIPTVAATNSNAIQKFLDDASLKACAKTKDDDAQSDVSTDTSKSGSVDSGLTTSSSDSQSTVEDSDDEKTTVMLRHLPESFTRDALVEMLNREGFHARFDYIYLPIHFSLRTTFGYAFINMLSRDDALMFKDHFEGFANWPQGFNATRAASVGWSDALQGKQAQVDRYRDSRIMHESMPDALKPALYQNGVRVPFPPPTKSLRPPRSRPAQRGKTSAAQ